MSHQAHPLFAVASLAAVIRFVCSCHPEQSEGSAFAFAFLVGIPEGNLLLFPIPFPAFY
jgi:hypothetical protein